MDVDGDRNTCKDWPNFDAAIGYLLPLMTTFLQHRCIFFTKPGARYTPNDPFFAPDSLTKLTKFHLQTCPPSGGDTATDGGGLVFVKSMLH